MKKLFIIKKYVKYFFLLINYRRKIFLFQKNDQVVKN